MQSWVFADDLEREFWVVTMKGFSVKNHTHCMDRMLVIRTQQFFYYHPYCSKFYFFLLSACSSAIQPTLLCMILLVSHHPNKSTATSTMSQHNQNNHIIATVPNISEAHLDSRNMTCPTILAPKIDMHTFQTTSP